MEPGLGLDLDLVLMTTASEISSRIASEKKSNAPVKRHIAILSVACVILYFLGINAYPLVDPAEAYYVEAAREMVELGNYITPHLNYQIYFSKPILTFWLMAFSYDIFGVSQVAARLPFALLTTLYVLATYFTTRRIANSSRAGLISGLLLACSPLLILVARESPIDIAFSTFIGIAVYATSMTLYGSSRFSWTFIYLGLALATLTKGPASIFLYLIGAGLFLLLARPGWSRLKGWLGDLKVVQGLSLFALIVLPWHIAVWTATEGLFLKVFFLYENVARFAGHTNMGRMSWWFFIPVLLVGFLPGIMLLGPAIKEFVSGRITDSSVKFKSLSGDLRALFSETSRGRALGFLLAFSAMTFAFFSSSGTKLITYILPVVGPLSILVAVYLDRMISSSESNLANNFRIFTGTVLIYGLSIFLAVLGASIFWQDLSVTHKLIGLPFAALFAFGAVWQFKCFRQRQLEKSTWISFATIVVSLGVLATLALNVFYDMKQADLKRLSYKAGHISDDISMFGVFMPSSMYYAKKPVNTFFLEKQIKPTDDNSIKRVVIVRDRDMPRVKNVPGLKYTEVDKAGQWTLLALDGFEIERVMILEDVFRAPGVFDRLMDGDTSMGPLTVPYAAGREYKGGSK